MINENARINFEQQRKFCVKYISSIICLGVVLQVAYFTSYYFVGPDSVPWYFLIIYTIYLTLQMLTTVEISFACLALKSRFKILNENLRWIFLRKIAVDLKLVSFSDTTCSRRKFRSKSGKMRNWKVCWFTTIGFAMGSNWWIHL